MAEGGEHLKVNTDPLFDLLACVNHTEVKIAHKLTLHHLTVKKAGRQKVKIAAQLFSNTNASALRWCGERGLIKSENWPECAALLKLFNDWFDVLNTRCPEPDRRDRMKGYGLALDKQLEILHAMTEMVDNMRVCGKQSLTPFQTGIMISTKAIQQLYNDLELRYNVKYLLTYRLNQDVLENFFSAIRAAGHLHDHPLPIEFSSRIRAYILGRNEGVLSIKANAETDDTHKLDITSELASLSKDVSTDKTITSNMLSTILDNMPNQEEPDKDVNEDIDLDLMEAQVEEDLVGFAGLTYIAGYVAFRMRGIDRTLGTPTGHFHLDAPEEQCFERTWINFVSEGGLLQPDPEFLQEVTFMEKFFREYNQSSLGTDISKCNSNLSLNRNPGFIANFVAKIRPLVTRSPTKAIAIFARTRMFIRIKSINCRREEEKRDKINRKMKKTVT